MWIQKVAALVAVVAAIMLSALAIHRPGASSLDAPEATTQQTDTADPSAAETEQPPGAAEVLESEIEAALAASSWPSDLDPSIDEVVSSPMSTPEVLACAAIDADLTDQDCAWGSGEAGTAMLVGDYVAIGYTEPLRTVLTDEGWQLYGRAVRGCPLVDLPVWNSSDPAIVAGCPEARERVLQEIAERQPDVLMIANDSYGADDWVQGSLRMLERVIDDVGSVVFIGNPPPAPNLADCYRPAGTPADCIGATQGRWTQMRKIQQELADTLGGTYVSSAGWFCEGGRCPAFVGSTPTRIDSQRMSMAYGEKIADAMAVKLARLTGFDGATD